MNRIKGIIIFIIILIISLLNNVVEAKQMNPSLYFGIQEIEVGSNIGYSIGDPKANGDGTTGGPSAKIWNIVQYNTSSATNPMKVNVYCVKAGVGFTEGEGIRGTQEYDLEFDMYTERDQIAKEDESTSNKILYNLVNGGHYNELLALANLIYLPGESTETEREELLTQAKVTDIWEEFEGVEGEEQFYITDDEIESVQQAAIWYFTNYDEMYGDERKYDKTDESSWLFYTTDSSTYQNLASYNPTGATFEDQGAGNARQQQAVKLYNYLIKTAKANANQYADSNVKHKNKLILYASTKQRDAQPLMKVERNPQEFDLALRKSIVSITNSEGTGKGITNLEGENAERQLNTDGTVKNINQTTIQGTTTTAEYYNRKDPVVVSTGDYITYSISIYNEGEKEGRATKIVDQLPEGLEFTEVVSGDFEVLAGGYDQTNNTLTLTRKSGNTTNLPAYNGTTLSSEVIQIKCKVTGTAGANNKILTNIAWIAEEVDGVTGETITTEVGKDRDSEPSTIQTQTKDQLVTEDEGYRGNASNNGKDITDNNSYFAGQQDDDDFEKIIIPKAEGNYKLQLQKVDENGNLITTSNAGFSWRLPGEEQDRTGTTANGLLDLGTVEITQTGTDTITITETNPPTGYNPLIGNITVEITKELVNGIYTVTDAKVVPENTNASASLENGVIKITISNKEIKEFDLALRKFISEVDGTSYNRQPNVDTSTIKSEGTGTYNHTKEPIRVNRESEITYTIRVYNEGEIDGYAEEVTDYIPEGLEFLPENGVNQQYEWVMYNAEGNITQNAEEAVEIKTDYLSKEKETDQRQNLIKAFDGETLSYKEIQVVCKVKADVESNVKLTNLAEITDDYNDYNEPDKDSTPDNLQIPEDLPGYRDEEIERGDQYIPGQEDDDDFEKVLVSERTGSYELQLQKVDEDGNLITTSGAGFSWTLPGQSTAQTGTTVNGILNLGTVQITQAGTDSITITETRAPEGYNIIVGNITVEVEKGVSGEDSNTYEATNVSLTSGGDQGAKVSLNGNIITITVPNKEIKEFDLALRKFISKVDGTSYNREPVVDTSTIESEGTATYNHPKQPVTVSKNSEIIYTIRVYNEGEIDGYAEEVTDYIPEGLEFLPEHETNQQYEWVMYNAEGNVTENAEEAVEIKTDYLSREKETEQRQNLIKAFDGTTLDYKEVKVACKVKETAQTNVKLTNLAEITDDYNEEGVPDKDSTPDNIEIPEDLPGYKDDEIDKDYVPGQEDDDDFEKVIIEEKEFDLALRKFITKVDEGEVTTRVPEVSYNREENQITYNHTKDPVEVVTGNVVEYTIRVFNEGDMAGYASEITDDIPDGLRFLPENATNVEYRWVMYDEEGNVTENVDEAVEIRTDYLSKEQEETEGENLLQAFNPDEPIGEGNPDYRDVKIAFEVVEPNGSDRIIVNSAQISEDSDENGNPVEDIDSTPNEWNEGEDDQDREYIKLTYFDLALRKWVTEAIVIEDGKETVTQTGHTAEMDPEPVVKVELYRKNLNDVTVKFRYKIRVTNEGDIAGYAKEITDYVPEGLMFVAEDNPGWTDEGNNIISTRLLENTLLQPGESAEVEVVLTWINGEDNMGQMTNIAEISEDYNDKGVPDRDSTPDNQVEGEDDIDDAPVLLSIETGRAVMYFTLGFTVLGTLAGGIVLIKRFVL